MYQNKEDFMSFEEFKEAVKNNSCAPFPDGLQEY